MNITIQPKNFVGEEGLAKLAKIMEIYFEKGGMQMQITCISKETLEEAYQNPDFHKNLVVRVGGYSEYFYRLSDELKRMVIDRSIQNEV